MRRITFQKFSLILSKDGGLEAFYSRLVDVDTANKILELIDDWNQMGEIVEFIANDLFYKQFTVDDLLDGLSANDFFAVLDYLQQCAKEVKG